MKRLLIKLILAAGLMPAATIYNFQWDTSVLKATNANYILDVLLIGDVGNQATISNLNYGTGGSGPSANVTLDTTVQFFNESLISFTPGSTFSFTLTVSNIAPVLPSGTPDSFSLYLLDADSNVIGTTDLLASAILSFDLAPTSISTYSGVSPLSFASPSLTLVPGSGGQGPPGGAIPEPSSLSLTLGALALWCLLQKKA